MAYRLVCGAGAIVLLTASALSACRLAAGPAAGSSPISLRWFCWLIVALQALLGLLLIGGVWRGLARGAAILWFIALSCGGIFQTATGRAPTLWLGIPGLSPVYWASCSLLLAAMLLVFGTDTAHASSMSHRRARVAVVGLGAIAGLIAVVLLSQQQVKRFIAGMNVDDLVVLEPSTWIGRHLPLLDSIDIGGRLATGDWTVVMYQHDCPYCRESLPGYGKQARALAATKGQTQFAFVEMPPYGSGNEAPFQADSQLVHGKLSQTRNWFATTPLVITLVDGNVTSAVAGDTGGGHSRLQKVVEAPPVEPSATVQLEGDRAEYDFGYVERSSSHRVDFLVGNVGDSPVRISRSKIECKCMSIPRLPETILPGGNGAIAVYFNAPKESLRYAKRALVFTDDPGRPTIALTIKAAVGRPLEVEPADLNLGRLESGREGKGEIVLVNRGRKACRPVYCTASGSGCIARIPRAQVPPGGRLSIPVIVCATGKLGRQAAILHIQTDNADQQDVDVTVQYEVVQGSLPEPLEAPAEKDRP